MAIEKIWFGKNIGKDLADIPSGYLLWMVENFDPIPFWKDTRGKTADEIQVMEDRTRDLLCAAVVELIERGDLEPGCTLDQVSCVAEAVEDQIDLDLASWRRNIFRRLGMKISVR